MDTNFTENSAVYGDVFATTPMEIFVRQNDRRLDLELPSGQSSDILFIFEVHDYYGSLIVTDNSTEATIRTDEKNATLATLAT